MPRRAGSPTRVTRTPESNGVAVCSITFIDGNTVDVEGELQAVIDELHKVGSRREHSFALFRETNGDAVAVRPETVVLVRPRS